METIDVIREHEGTSCFTLTLMAMQLDVKIDCTIANIELNHVLPPYYVPTVDCIDFQHEQDMIAQTYEMLARS